MATLSLFSCQDQEIPIEQVVAEKVEAAIPDDAVVLGRARTPEAAIAEAIDAMEALEAINHTGAKSNRRVGDITAVRNPEFGAKGNDLPDTMMYIVNFTDNMGYALVSADYRTSTIYALASEGSIDLSDDANEPPALAVFHANAETFYRQEIEHFHLPLPADGIKDDDDSPVPPTPKPVITMQYGPWETTQIISPLVPVQWGQGSPYNDNAPLLDDGTHAAAGCVATAIAQIMAYHRYPLSYNWDEMLKYKSIFDNWQASITSKTEIARLFRTIGDNVGMQWGSQSGAYTSDAPKHFNKMGYASTGVYMDYDFDKTKISILDGIPIIIRGDATQETHTYKKWFLGKTHTEYRYRDGHAWVIDGMINRRRKVEVFSDGMLTKSYYQYEQLLHCNWGWNGTSNGYYNNGAFNTGTGPIIATSVDNYSTVDYHFQFNIKSLYNVKP